MFEASVSVASSLLVVLSQSGKKGHNVVLHLFSIFPRSQRWRFYPNLCPAPFAAAAGLGFPEASQTRPSTGPAPPRPAGQSAAPLQARHNSALAAPPPVETARSQGRAERAGLSREEAASLGEPRSRYPRSGGEAEGLRPRENKSLKPPAASLSGSEDFGPAPRRHRSCHLSRFFQLPVPWPLGPLPPCPLRQSCFFPSSHSFLLPQSNNVLRAS